jgi:membrane-bound lytic murein transglycosylase A
MLAARGQTRVPLLVSLLAVAALALSACATAPMKQAGVGKPSASAHKKPGRKPSKGRAQAGPAKPAAPPAGPRPYVPPPADQPMRAHGRLASLSGLRGWAEEDHAAAFRAFVAGCAASRDPSLRALCNRARGMGQVDEDAARRFFEANFRYEGGDSEGVLTAYFAPEYEARLTPDAEFSMPVRAKPGRSPVTVAMAPAPPPPPPRPAAPPPAALTTALEPADTIDALLGADEPADPSDEIDLALSLGAQSASGRPDPGSELVPSAPPPPPPVAAAPRQIVGYTSVDLANADRRTIETAPPNGALAWMRAEDLFFLQIQGSGTLRLPDGRRMKAAYSGDNGKPFVAIARPMVEAGHLQQNKASGDGIRGWLAAHRGREALEVMWKNPRYVFFSLTPDDGKEPAGAAGIPLPAGRSLAVDPSRHAYGEMWWIDAEAPILAGANAKYRRLAMALDTGAAIRGEVRADLYIGRGDQAGIEAGRVRHTLRMMRLVPVEATAKNGADETDFARR